MLLIQLIISFILAITLFWLLSHIIAIFSGAPSVCVDRRAIGDVLRLSGIEKGQVFLDLGCGDGRSLILASKRYGARGIGIERSPFCYFKSRFNVWAAGESKNIQIVYKNIFNSDDFIKKADIVYIYLLIKTVPRLEKKIFTNKKKSAKIISLSFPFKYRRPDKVVMTNNLKQKTSIYLYK